MIRVGTAGWSLHAEHRDRLEAKFWLEPVQVARNQGFTDHELNRIHRLVVEHAGVLLEAWNDYFAP